MKLLLLLLVLLPGLAFGSPESAVRDALQVEARRALPDTVVEVAVVGVSLRGRIEVPEGAELRVRADGDEDWLGRVSAEVTVYSRGRELGVISAVAEVLAYIEVPVTNGLIGRGQPVGPGDLSFVRRDVSSLPRGVLTDPLRIVGRSLKRDVGLNQLLRESDLDVAVDAHRNQPVQLVVSHEGLLITAPGLLKRDARIGEVVEVTNLATKATVYGVLTGPERVELVTSFGVTASR